MYFSNLPALYSQLLLSIFKTECLNDLIVLSITERELQANIRQRGKGGESGFRSTQSKGDCEVPHRFCAEVTTGDLERGPAGKGLSVRSREWNVLLIGLIKELMRSCRVKLSM